jgi:hypothetical protein
MDTQAPRVAVEVKALEMGQTSATCIVLRTFHANQTLTILHKSAAAQHAIRLERPKVRQAQRA